MPSIVYYALGQIEYSCKYSMKEVLEKVRKYKTYGPWDKKLLNNKY